MVGPGLAYIVQCLTESLPDSQEPVGKSSRAGVLRFSVALLGLAVLLAACENRTVRTSDVAAPDGFEVTVAVDGLDAPTMSTFDDQGRMLIAESAYGGGGEPKVTRIEPGGGRTTLVEGEAFGEQLPVTAVAHFEDQVYVVHAGTVSIIDADGSLTPVLTELPGLGDHQANQLVFSDNWMYLGVGTMTNSAVVGTDNAVFGWLEQPERQQLHDIPCEDITLLDRVFEAENPLADSGELVATSAYSAFGDASTAGETVAGDVRCNGAILRARPDGSELEVYAWGFRNPYGLEVGPDGALYATVHGFDARGERPIENAWDCFYEVEEGAWYGFPDFACDTPVTDPRFKPHDRPPPQFLLAEHPTETPPRPIARFDPHAATNGFAFAPSDAWGAPDDAFIALFGDFTPATGTVARPEGIEVVRVNAGTGEISAFLFNRNSGAASSHSAGGLEHPSDVVFGPDGAMYVTDWGVAHITVDGLKLDANTGVVWRIAPGEAGAQIPGGLSLLYTLFGTLVLGIVTLFVIRGTWAHPTLLGGLFAGLVGGLVMGVVAMIVSRFVLNLPWYAPTRVFATMIMGRAAVANILEFVWLPFIVGLIVVLVLTGVLGSLFSLLLRVREVWRVVVGGLLYGLAVFGLLQYLLLPPLFPLVAEKGFPPFWYGATFAVFGLTLGTTLALLRRSEGMSAG